MKPKYLHAATIMLLLLVVGTQSALGTRYIPSDPDIGMWDEVNRKYTLITDVSEPIVVDEDNLTLDGAGHIVKGDGTGNGIHLEDRSWVTIEDVSVEEFYHGIFLNNSSNNILTGNITANNYIGIELYDSSDNKLTGNTASNNDFGIALHFSGTISNTLTYNIANSNKNNGIMLSNCSGNTLTSNTANANIHSGILLTHSNDNIVNGNTASYSSGNERAYGIQLSYSGNNTLSNNTANSNNHIGILLIYDCSNNTLTGNTVLNNNYGIYLHHSSTYNTVTSNNASSNGYGIMLRNSSYNTLDDNTTSNNMFGISLSVSNNNQIYNNNVSDNGSGIGFGSSNENQVFNNNFISNKIQASVSNSCGNIFNLEKPIGGNYWSDWTLPDADDDGFVDIPYIFIAGQDNLPWADPDGWLNQTPVASAGGPYLVAVGSSIMLDASGSYDPDSDTLEGWWELYDPALGQIDGSIFYASYQAGITYVTLIVDDGIATSTDETMIVIYNPDGGFVTGGGWIWSPAGAYYFDPWLEGKANFGFVSKYKKGATIPTGQTEFLFQAGDLNFHSSSYEWLVVTGSDYARFKGWGSINGFGDYKFMLWAGDGNPDTFRIKIWIEDELGVETIIYDNGINQPIDGGNIVVHTN